LDFSTEDLEANVFESSATNGSPQKRADSTSTKATSKLTNGKRQPALKPSALSYEDGRDDTENMEDDTALYNGGDSFQMINGGDDEEEVAQVEGQPEFEPEPEPEPELPKKGRGRPKAKGKEKAVETVPEPEPEVEVEAEPESEPEAQPEPEPVNKPVKKGRGKTKKEPLAKVEEPPAKKIRRSLESAEAVPKPVAKNKSSKTSKPTAEPKARVTSKKPKLAAIAEAESPNIQHAPPLPRNNRGLFILRRETPMEGTGFKQSRYGRNSVKPVAWWKNERIEYSEDEAEDGNNKFLLSRIKEVVRKDEVEDTRPKRTYHKPSKGKGKKRAAPADEEDDDEAEAWEADPGRIYAEVRQWDPADQVGAEAAEEEEEVAWSSAAIITTDVAGANFGFAKCLTMPFFGAGMVDLPIGAIKKPKNSRKMQMVFFVYTGRVQVTINGGDPFRISKGGMWQVPRGKTPLLEYLEWILILKGNFYSIYNDSDKPARVFFSQGCEIEAAKPDGEE
jgi:centromere protein C